MLDGTVLWETAAPQDALSDVPPSVVNDVVFVGRTGENRTGNYELTQGGLIAMNKVTGKVIKDYDLEINFHGGIAIQGKYIMFGTGYTYAAATFNGTGALHVWSL